MVQALQQGIYFGFDETDITLDISSVEPLERFVRLIPERINPGDLVRILWEFIQVDDVRPKVPGTPFVNTDAFPHKILACIQGCYIPYGQDSCVLFMLVNQGLSATSAQRLTGMAAVRL